MIPSVILPDAVALGFRGLLILVCVVNARQIAINCTLCWWCVFVVAVYVELLLLLSWICAVVMVEFLQNLDVCPTAGRLCSDI